MCIEMRERLIEKIGDMVGHDGAAGCAVGDLGRWIPARIWLVERTLEPDLCSFSNKKQRQCTQGYGARGNLVGLLPDMLLIEYYTLVVKRFCIQM